MRLSAPETVLDHKTVHELFRIVREFPGTASIELTVQTGSGDRCLRFGPQFSVEPESGFYAEVRTLLGDAAIG